MYQRDQIIEQLAIQSWPPEKQDEVVEIAVHRIGAAVTEQLSEQQFNEYEAIVNDNQTVIDAWLAANAPNYKDSPVYQELAAGYEEDPEKNNPAKLFASIAWIQVNVPQAQAAIDRALEAVKQELVAP